PAQLATAVLHVIYSLFSHAGGIALIAFHPSFFFNASATTEIYTLSLHDALPISASQSCFTCSALAHPLFDSDLPPATVRHGSGGDRKSTRLNSSHVEISYAVFCLKKKTVDA